MHTSRFERFLPVAGIIAAVCFAAFAALGGSPPGVKSSAATQVAWYDDHGARVMFAGLAAGLFLVAMAFFATGLRQALRSGEPGESTYSSVAYAGGLLVGFAVAVWGWLGVAAANAADNKQGAVIHTLAYLNDVGWLPWAAASAVLLLGTGLGGLRTAALPKWLAIVTIVLGVACLGGPTGIAVYFVTPFWLLVTGIVLIRRLSAASGTVTTSTGMRAEETYAAASR
jgi:hypothetical protein